MYQSYRFRPGCLIQIRAAVPGGRPSISIQRCRNPATTFTVVSGAR
jgi:hypothetical protein